MNIDRNNYEIFFLDYHEGKLTANEVAELMVFLEENPDLKSELEDFDGDILIPRDELSFENKAELKKIPGSNRITTANYEHYFIAFVENDLNPQERQQLEAFMVHHQELKPELEKFQKTILVPDTAVIYGNKSELKHKKAVKIRPLYYYVSAAASILLVLGIYFFNRSEPERYALNTGGTGSGKKSVQEVKAHVPVENPKAIETGVPSSAFPKKKQLLAKEEKNTIDLPGSREDEPFLLVKKEIIFAESKKTKEIGEVPLNEVAPAAFSGGEEKEVVNTAKSTDLSLPEFIASKFETIKENKEQRQVEEKTRSFKLVNLAYLGAAGIKKITGKPVNLKTKYNSKGQMVVFAISTEKFEFSKSRNR